MRRSLALPVALALLACAGASFARASQYGDAPQAVALAPPGRDGAQVFRGCVLAAARANGVPPAVLLMMLQVEGGRLGRVSGNTNWTVDIGPWQVNEIWLPEVARRWGLSVAEAFPILRDNPCGNADAAAFVFKRALADARGDFWEGVGRYHSARPHLKAIYLRKVLAAARRMLPGDRRG